MPSVGRRKPAARTCSADVAACAAALLSPLPDDATVHDRAMAAALARILSGGDAGGTVSEARLLDLEREGFMRLVRMPATQERIAHTLATGQRLRN